MRRYDDEANTLTVMLGFTPACNPGHRRRPRAPPAHARRRAPARLLYARRDPDRFDRAIVRWHGRLCLDAGGLDTPTAQTALAAASSLPTPQGRAGAGLLAAIAAAHDLPDVADVLDQWRERDTTHRP